MLYGFFRKLFYYTILIILVMAGSGFYLLMTASGLKSSVWMAAHFLPGKLEIHELKGRLIDQVSISKLIYTEQDDTLIINNLLLDWNWNIQKNHTLLKGTFQAKKIVWNDITLLKPQGNFSGNSLKNSTLAATFKAKYNKLVAISSLKFENQQLNLRMVSGVNELNLQGHPPYSWQANAIIKQPGLLHPVLLDLHSTITVHAKMQGKQRGNLFLTLDRGFLDTQAMPHLTFEGLNITADLTPKTLKSNGILTIDAQKKFTFDLSLPKLKHWQGTAVYEVAGNQLHLTGKGHITPDFNGTISVKGQDFPLLNSIDYKIFVSPQLQVAINPNSTDITGNILIPKAELIPYAVDNGVVLNDDITYVDVKEKTLPFNINCNVGLTMGDSVLVKVKGLNALLTGNIMLSKVNQGPITASGQLTLKDGKYTAYGQDLEIEQGQLLFTGGAFVNPGIQLRASRTFNNTAFGDKTTTLNLNNNAQFSTQTTVGVQVNGWLNKPKITLFSNPANLSQTDILSMLLLGRPAKDANKSGAQLIMAALSSMNVGTESKAAQLLEQLKNSLGVDLDVKTNTVYNQNSKSVTDSTGVVIGKSLSKRLYVSYNRGLSTLGDANLFTLKYLLNNFFSIQVTASENDNGIDIIYSSKSDGKKNAK